MCLLRFCHKYELFINKFIYKYITLNTFILYVFQSIQVSNEPFLNICQDSPSNSIQVPEANIVQGSNQLNFPLSRSPNV